MTLQRRLSPFRRRGPLTVLGLLLMAVLTAALTGWSGTTGAPRSSPPSHAAESSRTAASGSTAGSEQLTVVGIGDSVTAGSACDCTDFVHRYAAQVPASAGGPTRAVNLGEGGQTSAQLLSELGSGGAMSHQVASADVVLVTIGANDLLPLLDTWSSSGCAASCSSPGVRAVARNITGIVDRTRALRAGHPTRILVTGYWNVFEDGDVASAARGAAYLAWSDALSRQLNTAVCSAAEGAGATCVDLYAPFKGDGSRNPTSLLAGDGDHPNAAGHDVIAAALLRATRF
jgi:lysophospholipase L1-like esterase